MGYLVAAFLEAVVYVPPHTSVPREVTLAVMLLVLSGSLAGVISGVAGLVRCERHPWLSAAGLVLTIWLWGVFHILAGVD